MARKAVLPNLIFKLLEDNHLLSANQIIEYLHTKGVDFNKTSVYRALEKLQESSVVCKQMFGDSEALYEIRADHHDHAVCTSCEKIVSVECIGSSNKNVPGFKVDHYHTTLYGLCDGCLK